MKNIKMKTVLFVTLIAALAVTLGGCFVPFDGFYPDAYCDFYGVDNRESISEGYFKLTIYTPKNEFAKGEAIDCWAQLEYIGDNNSITVYVAGDKLINMDMASENTRYECSQYSFIQKEHILQKGVPVRYMLSEEIPKSKSVLPGRYEINAYVDVSLSPNGMVSYWDSVSAVIEVRE